MKVCVIYGIKFPPMNCVLLGNATETVSQVKVCDIQHMVHSDKLFSIRQENGDGSS